MTRLTNVLAVLSLFINTCIASIPNRIEYPYVEQVLKNEYTGYYGKTVPKEILCG